jgi:CBS domain-containing protein
MTGDAITVGSNAPVEDAARMLRRHKIGALPVIDDGGLVGIVTETDLFDALVCLRGGDIVGVRLSVSLPNGMADLAAYSLRGVEAPLGRRAARRTPSRQARGSRMGRRRTT